MSSQSFRFLAAARLLLACRETGSVLAGTVCVADGYHGVAGNLQGPQHQQEAPPASGLPLFAKKVTDHSCKPRLVFGYYLHSSAARVLAFGRHELACAAHAQKLGGNVRIGFENNLELPNGTPARDNAQLISLAIAQGNSLGLIPTQANGDKHEPHLSAPQ